MTYCAALQAIFARSNLRKKSATPFAVTKDVHGSSKQSLPGLEATAKDAGSRPRCD